MLNRKQKIVILVSIFLLMLSFLFPPWADYFPVGSTHELVATVLTSVAEDEKMVVFVGYSSLFNRPKHYLHEYHSEPKYSNEAQEAIEAKQSHISKADEPVRVPAGFLVKFGIDAVLVQKYDSIIEAGKTWQLVNDRILGFAGIYHELLLIQLSLIVLISIGLIFVLRD